MPIPYSPLAIANEFVARHSKIEAGIEHMKLQKLVYCANGWWLLFNPERPLVDEAPEVWKFGPVFPSLYRVLKVYGRSQISLIQSRSPFEPPERVDENDPDTINLIDWTWQRYGHLSSFALSDMTHKQGTAWRRLAEEQDFRVPEGLDIPPAYIVDEFKRIHDRDGRERAG